MLIGEAVAHRETISDLTVCYEPDGQQGYVVTVMELPGLVTEGRSPEEARLMVMDAIDCYRWSARKDAEEASFSLSRSRDWTDVRHGYRRPFTGNLPPCNSDRLATALTRADFQLHTSTAVHRAYKHPRRAGRIVIPFHDRELGPATLYVIVAEASLAKW